MSSKKLATKLVVLDLSQIAQRFRKLRGTELAEIFCRKIEISPSEWSQYENAKRKPSLERFAWICFALGLSADWLLFGEKRPHLKDDGRHSRLNKEESE